jgi:glycosyltransferase involved in cell wall biosynthesis
MKLCIIGTHKYCPKLGINQLDLKTWLALSSFFDEVHIIAFSTDDRFHVTHEKNIYVHLSPNLKSKPLSMILFFPYSLIVGLRLAKKGTIVFDASEPVGGGITSLIIHGLTRRKMVLELQGEVFRRDVYGFFIPLVSRFVACRADIVRAISWSVMKMAMETGVPKEKIVCIPQRVDLAKFNPNINGRYARNLVGLNDNDPVIAFVGTLIPVKGVPYLIQAFSQVLRVFPNAKLLIVGDGPLRKKLTIVTEKLRISQSVIFSGQLDHSEIPKLIAASSMLVLPSLSEGIPRVLLEAMACGKPVLASNVGGIRELVIQGKNGLLVECGDVNGLAKNMTMLLQDTELAGKMGKNGRKFVEQNYSFEKGIRMMLDIYQRLATPKV